MKFKCWHYRIFELKLHILQKFERWMLYRKIPLTRLGHIYGQGTNLMSLYLTRRLYTWWGLIFGRKITSICNPLNLLFFLFFQHTVRISAFFTSCKLWNMFKVNDKVKNKDTVDVVLPSLLLTLNIFHFLLQCSKCWLWSDNCRLGLLFYCSDALRLLKLI